MRTRSKQSVAKIGVRLGVAIISIAVGLVGNSAEAVPLVNPSFFGQPNTTYQEWDGFTSPTGPNPATHVNNPYGTPNWLDTTATTDGAFIIGPPPSSHIYSFGGVLNLLVTVPTPTLSAGATTTLVLQAEVLGSPLSHSLFGVSYAGLVGDPILPTHITEVNEGELSGGFGGADYYYLVEWDSLPAAASYSVTYSPGETSSSQYSARVDTLTVAPPVTLAGDVNNDGIVNGQDIALVASDWLHAGDNLAADANKDGIVNGQDIALIASNWLHASGDASGQAAAVPEPSTFVLLGLGLLAVVARRRKG